MTLTCDFDSKHGDGTHCDACQLVKCQACWDKDAQGDDWTCGECLARYAEANAALATPQARRWAARESLRGAR